MTLPSQAATVPEGAAQPDAVVRSMRALALAGVAGLVLLGLPW